jgi:hypothetical protein
MSGEKKEHLTPLTQLAIIVSILLTKSGGVLAVKYLVDSGKYKNITYILSGSSSINIKKPANTCPAEKEKASISFFDRFLFLISWR